MFNMSRYILFLFCIKGYESTDEYTDIIKVRLSLFWLRFFNLTFIDSNTNVCLIALSVYLVISLNEMLVYQLCIVLYNKWPVEQYKADSSLTISDLSGAGAR